MYHLDNQSLELNYIQFALSTSNIILYISNILVNFVDPS